MQDVGPADLAVGALLVCLSLGCGLWTCGLAAGIHHTLSTTEEEESFTKRLVPRPLHHPGAPGRAGSTLVLQLSATIHWLPWYGNFGQQPRGTFD